MTAQHRADVQTIFIDFLILHLRLLLARQVAHKQISYGHHRQNRNLQPCCLALLPPGNGWERGQTLFGRFQAQRHRVPVLQRSGTVG